jgi:peptidyl-prolyl cis-trans isomerase D
MLSTLRDYSSYFLWFVVVTFVGFMAFSGLQECGTSPAQRGILAEINGQPITLQVYSMAVSRATQNQQAQVGDELTDQQIAQIRDQTWQQMIGALLLDQEATRREIKVTDQELATFLRQYPPEDIRAHPAFQTEGNFDYAKYQMAMTNTAPEWTDFWRQVEAYWRPQLRTSKLQQQIISTVRVSDAELEDFYRKGHDAARIEFLLINSNAYNDEAGTPTQEELLEVYEDEKYRYRRFDRVQLELAVWNRVPSASDRDWALTQANDVHQQLVDGADFAEMAEQYTMDPSGTSTGGDLGWFGKGAMVAPFESAAYALEVGAISAPVETQFGFHIIRLEERRSSDTKEGEQEVRARHILIRPLVSQATVDSLSQAAQDFALAVRTGERELSQATTQEAGATWFRPQPLQQTDNIPIVGSAPDLKAWAFNADAGAICDPIDDGGKIIVARMVERREPGVAPLDEVRSMVQQRWITKKARELARAQADSLYQEATGGAVTKDLAAGDNVTLTTTGLFTRNTNVAQVGKSPIFMGTVFSLTEEGPWSDVVPVENGWAIIHVLEMQESDIIELATVRDSVAGELLRGKQNTAFTQWVADLYERAEINDFRGTYYGSL